MNGKRQVKELVKECQLFDPIERDLLDDEQLHWDSMSLMWFIMSLEKNFEIQLDYRTVNLDHFSTIEKIDLLIENETKGARLWNGR